MLTLISTTPLFLALFYFAKNKTTQHFVLILATILLYFFIHWQFGIIFLAFTIINTLLISSGLIRQRSCLILGIIFNLSLLILFKYLPQLTLTSLPSTFEQWIFPVGLSFYALQGISALVDSHKKKTAPELLDLIIYLCFFPHLLMGPILRLNSFINSISFKLFSANNIKKGFIYIALGLFFKKVLADNLALQTQWLAYPQIISFHSLNVFFQLLAEYIRFYADFFGYSLIAYGLAKLFSYTIILNFNSPIASSSMADFWRRWNMSLSSFLRDYVYIPLGGKSHSPIRTYLNLALCFILTGLWHGGSLSFVFWGGFHGLVLIIEKILSPICLPLRKRIPILVNKMLSLIYTTSVLAFSMIFLRFQSVDEIKLVFQMIFSRPQASVDKQQLFLIFLFIIPLLISDFMKKKIKVSLIKSPVFLALLILIILVSFAPERQFTYMRF